MILMPDANPRDAAAPRRRASIPPRSLHRLLAALALLTGSVLLAGCPSRSPHIDDVTEIRLRGLQGEDVEGTLAEQLRYERESAEARQRHLIESLGMLGTKRSEALLDLIAVSADSETVRNEAAEASAEIRQREGARPDVVAARKRYFDRLQAAIARDGESYKDLDAYDRTVALLELAWFGFDTADRVADSIGTWYGDPQADKKYRDRAVAIAASLPTLDSLRALTAMTGDFDYYLADVMPSVRATAERFPDRRVEALRAHLDRPENIRGAAYALTLYGDEAALVYFEPLITGAETRREERARALRYAASIKGDHAYDVAFSVVENEDYPVEDRVSGLDWVRANWRGSTGDDAAPGETYGRVAPLVRDWPVSLRRAAVTYFEAAGEFGARDLYYDLIEADSDPQVRRTALRLRIRAEATEPNERDASLLTVLADENDPETAAALLRFLRTSFATTWADRPDVRELTWKIYERYRNGESAVRAEALAALQSWGTADEAMALVREAKPREMLPSAGSMDVSRRRRRAELLSTAHAIVSRDGDGLTRVARQFDYRHANDETRAFVLVFLDRLAVEQRDGIVRQMFTAAGGNNDKALKDLLLLEPWYLPDAEAETRNAWLDELLLLLMHGEGRVRDAAHRRLFAHFRLPTTEWGIAGSKISRDSLGPNAAERLKRVITFNLDRNSDAAARAIDDFVWLLPDDDVAILIGSVFESRPRLDAKVAIALLGKLPQPPSRDYFLEFQLVPLTIASIHASEEVRRVVVSILDERARTLESPPRHLVSVVSRMVEDRDDRVRHSARAIVDTFAARVLDARIDDPPPTHIVRVYEALATWLVVLADSKRENNRIAAATIVQRYAPIAAVQGPLGNALTRAVFDIALREARDDDSPMFETALRLLAEIEEYGALVAAANSRSTEVRRVAVRLIAEHVRGMSRFPEDFAPAIDRLLGDSDDTVARAALSTLDDAVRRVLRDQPDDPAAPLVRVQTAIAAWFESHGTTSKVAERIMDLVSTSRTGRDAIAQAVGSELARTLFSTATEYATRPASKLYAASIRLLIGIANEPAARVLLVAALDHKSDWHAAILDVLRRNPQASDLARMQTYIKRGDSWVRRGAGVLLYTAAAQLVPRLQDAMWLLTTSNAMSSGNGRAGADTILVAWEATVRVKHGTDRAAADRELEREYRAACARHGEAVYSVVLDRIGAVISVDSIEFLMTLLENDDASLRAYAARLALSLPLDDRTENLLAKALTDPSSTVRAAVVRALGESGDYVAMQRLVAHRNWVRAKVPKDQIPAELQLITSALSLILGRQRDAYAHEPAAACGKLKLLLDECDRDDTDARIFWLTEIAQLQTDVRVAILADAMADRHDVVRLAALKLMITVEGPRALPYARPMLRDGSKAVRLEVVAYVARSDAPDARDLLVTALRDGDATVRLKALEALGRDLAHPSLLADIEALIGDDDERIRQLVLDYAASSTSGYAIGVLQRGCRDRSDRLRRIAFEGVWVRVDPDKGGSPGELQIDDAAELCDVGLRDGDRDVRRFAAHIARSCKVTAVRATLQAMADNADEDFAVREACRNALAAME